MSLVLTTVAAAAQAQTTAQSSIEEGLRRQEERSREQQKELQPHADALRAASSATTVPELPAEQPCFVIREIALVGKDAGRFRWLSTSTDAFIGRCVGTKGIASIAAYLDAQQ